VALLDELQRADRLQATALADLEAGRPSRAERRVLRVLGALDRLPVTPDVDQLRIRSLLSLASARADLRSVDDGLQVLVRAATVVERTGDPTMQAMWDLQHAWLLLGAGRPRDALPSFNAAVAELPRLSPHNGWSALNGRAFAHSDLHDIELARADWAECADLAGAAGLSDLQFAGLHNLAWADFLSGDLPRSLAGMDRAAKMHVAVDRGVVKMDRARVLTEAGSSTRPIGRWPRPRPSSPGCTRASNTPSLRWPGPSAPCWRPTRFAPAVSRRGPRDAYAVAAVTASHGRPT
jgi:hypothetical protein